MGKNPKLKPKWIGPYLIININDKNAKLQLKPNKFKIVNVARLKPFFEDSEKCLSEDDKHLSEDKYCLDQDINTDPPCPMTRALQKLIHFEKAAAVAVSLIQHELEPECDVNMFAEKYDKYHCPIVTKAIKILLIFQAKLIYFRICKI